MNMEAETPCVEFVYQRMVQLTARAFYSLEMKILFKEDEHPETIPAPRGRASKKQPVNDCKSIKFSCDNLMRPVRYLSP